MTNETPSTQVPAGWYPDHTGAPQLRWWDGMSWTEHVQPNSPPAANPYQTRSQPTRVADGTPVYTPMIWLIVLLPVVVSLVDLVRIGTRSVDSSSFVTTEVVGSLLSGFVPFTVYVGTVVLAFFDNKKLTELRYDRPFHWAWAFLGFSVYVIGRAVIVRRRSGRGFAIFWVWLGVALFGIVTTFAQVSIVMSRIFETF